MVIELTGAPINEHELEHLVTRVFFKGIDLLGGLHKLAEYKTLTWLPSLARASYAIVLREEYLKTEEEKENIANMRIEFILNLILEPSEEVKSVLSNEDIIMKYAEGTGLLTVYPYIRHMADVLHREARIFIPPYPPVKVKPPK